MIAADDAGREDPGHCGDEVGAGAERGSALEVLLVACRLGLTSFGGPVAHLGYFRTEYVVRRRWLDEGTFADLVALAQFLPGAASSKVGMSVGFLRAGFLGGIAAWVGFTFPSAAGMVAFAYVAGRLAPGAGGWLQGLRVVAVAVVAQAVWSMARTLAPDRLRTGVAIAGAAISLALPTSIGQIAVIAAGALIGWRFLQDVPGTAGRPVSIPIPRPVAVAAWAAFFALLAALPLARSAVNSQPLATFTSFYLAGSLVFGGGHVVLPLLQAQVVAPGWVGNEQFLAGYGAAQALPGPLFTFAAYLGAVMRPQPNGIAGAAIALAAIFLPSFLLTVGALPFWAALRLRAAPRAALRGVNAAVVGVLLAALYNPVWTGAVHGASDFSLALIAFGLLAIWKAPPWLVVALIVAASAALTALAAHPFPQFW